MYACESFVTSGPRIRPRFFAGAGLVSTDDSQALVEQGYANGVPMGGTLEALETAPTFNVHASKDPDGANLDRIQIIKGWVNEKGEPQERIINIVWSGNRVPDDNGKLPAVGNTIDLETAMYTNTIGSSQLLGSWTDDQFDPE